MADGRSKWLVRTGAAVIVIAVLWAAWVRLLPRESRNDEATFGQFLLALIGFLTAVLGSIRGRPGSPAPAKITDDLASAEYAQWHGAAGERNLLVPAPIPLHWRPADLPMFGGIETVIADDSVAVPFPPLPGMAAVTRQTSLHGGRRELLLLYGGLPTGRLVVVGAAGSGKTSTGVLLALDALEHRTGLAEAERARTPVPILLTLSSWDPLTEPFERWLITRLRETNPVAQNQRRHVLQELCRGGSLSLILDGLDEVPADTRVTILEALGTQATGRIVILSRPAEMVLAARTRYLTGALAIALEPVTGRDAAAYLERALNRPAPAKWDALLADLRAHPAGAASRALSKPLTVTLIRDALEPGDDVSGLLANQAIDGTDFEGRLLDRFTTTAYQGRLDSSVPNVRSAAADRTLGWIAADMKRRGTRDLGWWQLPLMVPLAWRTLLIAAVAYVLFVIDWSWGPEFKWEIAPLPALLAALSFGAITTLATQWRLSGSPLERPVLVLAAVGLICGVFYSVSSSGNLIRILIAALGIAFGSGRPALLGRTRLPGRLQHWPAWVVLLIAFTATLIVGLSLNALVAGPFGLVLLLAVLAILRITQRSDVSSLGPPGTWRSDALHALTAGAIFGGVVGLAVLANWSPFAGPDSPSIGPSALVGGSVALAYYTVAGLIFATLAHSSGQTWIAALWLRGRAHAPVRILRFLDDARRRGILRTVGAVYQFRHATLQDRLATKSTATVSIGADRN
jgi:hypothetical protein